MRPEEWMPLAFLVGVGCIARSLHYYILHRREQHAREQQAAPVVQRGVLSERAQKAMYAALDAAQRRRRAMFDQYRDGSVLEQRAAQALALYGLWIKDISKVALTEEQIESRALRRGDLRVFAVYNESPIDDERICIVFRHDGLWYAACEGVTRIYTELIGTTADVNPDQVWRAYWAIRKQANIAEGNLRRQN